MAATYLNHTDCVPPRSLPVTLPPHSMAGSNSPPSTVIASPSHDNSGSTTTSLPPTPTTPNGPVSVLFNPTATSPHDHAPYTSQLALAQVDPGSVMKQLNPVLGDTGCIRNPQDAPTVVNFMKQSTNQLVHRCIVLNVIRATESPKTLTKFMDVGGWGVLNVWLSEAKKSQNTPLLLELLQVLQKLPVSKDSLRQGNMGKIVKQLSKQENTAMVQGLAGELLTKWMAVFRDGQLAKPKSGVVERRCSVDDAPPSTTSRKKGKKEGGKVRGGSEAPPPESIQLPPGPMVALGRRPKEKSVKRSRELLVEQQVPAEKKSKTVFPAAVDVKSGKGMIESEGFMNALSTQAAKMKGKKAKRQGKGSKPSRTSSTSSSGPDAKQAKEEGTELMEDDSALPDDGVRVSVKKKKVSWASEDNLTSVHYFELDESERVNVNRSFLDAANKEKLREREALESGLMFSRDRLIEMIPWQRPSMLEVSEELVDLGAESTERAVQVEREGRVLAQLFLSKASVRPSPLEPDPETECVETELKLIPLMEGSLLSSGVVPPPRPLQPGASGGLAQPLLPPSLPLVVFASPPHVPPANASMYLDSPLPSPASTINQAQSLLNFFSKQHGELGNPSPSADTSVPTQPGKPPSHTNFQGRPDNNGGTSGATLYHNNGANFHPPVEGPPHVQQHGEGPVGMHPAAGQWGNPEGGSSGGGYYGDGGYFRGQSDQNIRAKSRGFVPQRGRGRGFQPWRRGKICKHFLSYGCKLGAHCRFLHSTPDYMNKMAPEPGFVPRGGQHRGRGGQHRGRGGWFEGPPGVHFEPNNGGAFDMQSQPHHHHGPHPNIPVSFSPPSGYQEIRSSPPAPIEEGGGEQLVMEERKAELKESSE